MERGSRPLETTRSWWVVLGALIAVLAGAVPSLGNPTDPPEPRPDSGVVFAGAYANDDGVVQGGDSGDVGESDAVYDAWGADSSVDPAGEGLASPRHDNDVARCTADVRDGDPGIVDVAVLNAYTGYVCTLAATFTNGTTVPVQVAPAIVSSDPGLTVSDISDPPIPASLESGASATAVLAARVEQLAAENSILSFRVIIVVTGEDEQPPGEALTAAHLLSRQVRGAYIDMAASHFVPAPTGNYPVDGGDLEPLAPVLTPRSLAPAGPRGRR